jgi:hypothetical protein
MEYFLPEIWFFLKAAPPVLLCFFLAGVGRLYSSGKDFSI